jgi:tetratricopeptide (TPR) repeat protein
LCRPFWVCVLLAVITAVVYWPAISFDYVNYDDPQIVYENPHVLGGLTWENVRWAFGTALDGNWIPLTWLSIMLDVEWSGPTAAGLHLTNILLHSANTVLIFLAFRRLTGAHWQSAVLAGLFGLHPLHVESVAWVSERKDVLSTLFWSLAIWMYAGYANRPAAHAGKPKWKNPGPAPSVIPSSSGIPPGWPAGPMSLSREYFAALAFFALGLMCKPMLVTLPFALLLLDYWPLQRIGTEDFFTCRAALFRLIREKIPFFLLATIAAVLTFSTQLHSHTMQSLAVRPLGARIANALVSYMRYLAKTFWPSELVIPYPLPRHWPWDQIITATVLLVGLSILAIGTVRRQSYGLVGWLWFLGTMVPVIGLTQAGDQAMADRYTYVSLLGVFWIGVWAAAELIVRWRPPGLIVALAVLLILGACATRTRAQLDYWRDGETLFRHAIDLTTNNYVALDGFGRACLDKQRVDEAVNYLLQSLDVKPRYKRALNDLDEALARIDAANAAANNPHALARQTGTDYADAHNTLGLGLAMNGKPDGAIWHFRKALFYNSDNVNARGNLAYALFLQGRLEEAVGQCKQILQRFPDNPKAHGILGLVLMKQGKLDQAVTHLREAMQYQPDNAKAHVNLGQALAALGQRDEAIAQFKEALRLNPNEREAREQLNKLEGLPK